jgi:hypothetical protein
MLRVFAMAGGPVSCGGKDEHHLIAVATDLMQPEHHNMMQTAVPPSWSGLPHLDRVMGRGGHALCIPGRPDRSLTKSRPI